MILHRWHRLDHGLALVALLHRHHGTTDPGGTAAVLIVGIADDNDGADAVVHAVVADAAEAAVAAAANGAEAPAPHDDGAEAETLDLEAEALLHVVVLHDVDLVRDLRVAQRLSEIGGLRCRERVEIILQLALVLVAAVVGGNGDEFLVGSGVGVDGEVDGAPVGAEEDVGGADVEEDHGVAGADVLLDGPADGVGALVGEVDGDTDFAAGAGGGGGRGGGDGGGRVVAWGRGVVDFDLRQLWVGIQCGWVLRVLHFLPLVRSETQRVERVF